jgi:NADH dehydrogenase FAD-containing subunit
VIGAGYAGLLFTMRLAGKVASRHVHIALVNDSDTFTERPRLHQFATNQEVQWRSLPQMLRRTNIQFIQGRVTSIDPAHHEIVVVDREPPHHVEYDYLVYALGSVTDRKSVPGVAEYAYTLAASGPLSAAALRETLPSVQARHGHVVVSGGGATGIETAAEVASAYPHIKVHLVTREPLALFLGKSVASSIRRRLVRLGVEIIDQTSVTAVHAHSVVIDQGSELACDLCCHFPQISGISSNRNELNTHTYSKFIWPSIPQIFGLTVLITINIRVSHTVFPIHWIGHLLHSA